MVEEHHAQSALDQLRRYEEENRGFRLRRVLPRAAPFARTGTLLFGCVLVLFAELQWRRAFGLDWLGAGAAHAGAIRDGELARTATALTLHADIPHLLSNLVFGSSFAYLLLHTLGGGIGLLALLGAGMLGNLLNAWVQSPEHLSIGASTAVFAAVGLLAGSEARMRHLLSEPDARRFAPVGAAALLLLYLGVGEGSSAHDVDVLAHVFGMLAGLPMGLALGALPRAGIEHRGAQLACALAALGLLGTSWALALTA